jgi:inosine-uridine nucleoside N-ribohydrolase
MSDNQGRRKFLLDSLLASAVLSASGILPAGLLQGREEKISTSADKKSAKKRTPVILDTDIGDDIDDTWALLMLLRISEIDLKLATTGFGNTRYRSRVLAKILELTGNEDIPIGIGLDATDKAGNQSNWLGDYQLNSYPGEVHEDGIGKIIDVIMNSSEPVTVLGIGPVMNIAAALEREPAIARNAKFVGMQGAIYKGYDGESKVAAEWNVKIDPGAFRKVIAAPWECSITPLDTCGIVKLKGEKYQQIYRSDDAWLKSLVNNYRQWLPNVTWLDPLPQVDKTSSTLFDTVAVYLAVAENLLEMEELPIRVTDEGFTLIDEEQGSKVKCATAWKDLAAFEDLMVDILSSRDYRFM